MDFTAGNFHPVDDSVGYQTLPNRQETFADCLGRDCDILPVVHESCRGKVNGLA